ncbi:MAG: hypothetical protein J6M94_07395 [Prevotella sp.]|nr:hypothetical protein [Prevotella sp.]
MKKITFALIAMLSMVGVKTSAQNLQPLENGYYRIYNAVTKRYISVHDDKDQSKRVNGTPTMDLGAIELITAAQAQTDPGSIILLEKRGSQYYNLKAQGTDIYSIMNRNETNFSITYAGDRDGMPTYSAVIRAASSGASATVYLDDENGKLGIDNPGTSAWFVVPVNNSDNALVINPTLTDEDGEHYMSFYSSFAYQLPAGVTAYYANGYDSEGKANMVEIKNKVPAATPVILNSTSATAKLLPIYETVASVSGNLLKGVYFNINKTNGTFTHKNQVAFNANTMRIFGNDGGTPRFIKGSGALAANSAYLAIDANHQDDVIACNLVEPTEEPSTITAKSYTIEYGDEIPEFEYTVEGGQVMGTPAITCDATVGSPVGTYDIVISKGTVKNKKATFVNGTLTIEKAPLTVTPGSYSMNQGEEVPTFYLVYFGFKNRENEYTPGVFTSFPVATCDATSTSEVGDYTIYVSGGEAPNYELKYENGTLTIEPKTGIDDIIAAGGTFDIYDLNGVLVREKAKNFDGVMKGVYIVNGEKYIVK